MRAPTRNAEGRQIAEGSWELTPFAILPGELLRIPLYDIPRLRIIEVSISREEKKVFILRRTLIVMFFLLLNIVSYRIFV